MIYTGKIFDIVHINDTVSQIILRKKDKDKIVPVAITVIGYWKDKAFKELKLKPKDKIRGNLYLKSRLYNGRYYTDAFFREIQLLEKAADFKSIGGNNMFQTDEGLVDTESGEVIT